MDTETIPEPIVKPKKYHTVNSKWPEGTNEGRSLKPTGEEAIRACKRLYRKWMGKPFSGKWKLTSGNRYTYPSAGVFYVNPDFRGGGGWHEVVHFMSHYVARRLYNAGHGPTHAFIEREMIAYVVDQGWLDGKLRSEPKPEPDKRAERYARVVARIEAWERKEKRAKTALRKLRASKARYEKVLAT